MQTCSNDFVLVLFYVPYSYQFTYLYGVSMQGQITSHPRGELVDDSEEY